MANEPGQNHCCANTKEIRLECGVVMESTDKLGSGMIRRVPLGIVLCPCVLCPVLPNLIYFSAQNLHATELVVHLKHLPSFVAIGFTNFPCPFHCRFLFRAWFWAILLCSGIDADADDDGIIMCRRPVHFPSKHPASARHPPFSCPFSDAHLPMALLPLPLAPGWVVKLLLFKAFLLTFFIKMRFFLHLFYSFCGPSELCVTL